MEKVKIVLDADVIIHFSKAGRLSILPDILPEYDYIVLDYVRDELRGDAKEQMDKMEAWMKKIKTIPFVPHGEMMREYILLNKTKGKGESACIYFSHMKVDGWVFGIVWPADEFFEKRTFEKIFAKSCFEILKKFMVIRVLP